MKATVKESHTFKPITVELVITTEEELYWLKAISNMSLDTVKNSCEYNDYLLKDFYDKSLENAQMSIYNFMDKL